VTGNRALFDSNIIIYLSRRELPFSIVDQFDEIFISVITYMEILGYDFEDPNEEMFIKDLLSVFKTIYIDQRIADTVVKIRRKKRIKLPDAIISATAISEGLYLVTRNVEDFHDIDVNLTNPFE
jgi:predicted nucleic acid-binding protein